MFSKTAFTKGRTPPVPEAFPKSATAGGKQKEENEEESQPLPNPPSPVTSEASRSQTPIPRLGDLITESSSNPISINASAKPLDILAETAVSRRSAGTEARARELIEKEDLNQAENISSRAAGKAHYVDMVQDLAVEEAIDASRETLCQRVGEMLGEDPTLVTIYPMLDIEHSDEAMITRVKDLLGPSVADEDVVVGERFIAEHEQGMAIVDDKALCGILVTTNQSHRGQVRVADLTNIKERRDRGFKGYEEIDVDPQKPLNSHVIIAKRGQNAIIQGRPTMRLFVRVERGTPKELAVLACEDAWLYRMTESLPIPPVWHDYFTKDQNGKTAWEQSWILER